ncbi:uncharacterized protein LOC110984766 [Acanthaster planci]|uniref:Uncharacterized protein LOC110984766 n=1 Tax=Acanthaster planci TaxID=133434 RepID=A0A8B7ZCM5_ACAPL|nr:uncharacterized protein LOC110984766 [Acanthaster planci]
MESETPVSKKRRRSKHCHHNGDQKRSSSSHSSSVEVTTATCRPTMPTIIATSSSKAPSREEAAIAMATVLASELRPEHKLPSRDILVQPKPKFMELLQTVGAQGPVLTARQVLSYLIKYISSRQLYVQQDPKRVYCEKDPLGKVFGVPTFTIKDARKLLFENMSVLRESPDFQTQHNDAFQRQQRTLYYTFHQAQQTDVARPSAVPTRSATAPSPHSLPSATHRLKQVDSTSKSLSAMKRTSGEASFTESAAFRGEDLSDGAHVTRPLQSNRDLSSVSVTSAPKESPFSSELNIGSARIPLSDQMPCTVTPSAIRQHIQAPLATPKISLVKETMSKRSTSTPCTVTASQSKVSLVTEAPLASDLPTPSAPVAPGLSMVRSPFSRGHKRKQNRLTSDSSEDYAHMTSRQNTSSFSETDKVANRPWYCVLYHPSEELRSQGSEVLSIQDCDTAIVADSSDDLWFVDEDEGTPVEYEVPSDSSDDYTINKGSSDDDSSGTEMVYDVLLQGEDSGDSHFADNSDEDTTDTEISDMDKWECTECSMRNSPFKRYCSRCWALRKGWLPDNQRMTLKERLQNSNRPLRRSFSAPAGNTNPLSPWCPAQTPCAAGSVTTGALPVEIRPTSPMQDPQNVDLCITEPSQELPRLSRDFADGMTPDLDGDMTDGKNDSEDEAGTGVTRSGERKHQQVSDEQGDNSQDTVLITQDSPGQQVDSDIQSEVEESRNTQAGIQQREDSGIGLTQESMKTNNLSFSTSSTVPAASSECPSKSQLKNKSSHPPRKRQRSASGSDLPEQNGLSLSLLKTFKCSASSIPHVGKGAVPHSLQTEKSDPGAGPSSAPANVVTKHYNDLCIICYTRPKTASIIHGRTGHQVCCYPCAKKLHHRGKPCPVCRRSIQAVIKNFLL